MLKLLAVLVLLALSVCALAVSEGKLLGGSLRKHRLLRR